MHLSAIQPDVLVNGVVVQVGREPGTLTLQ